MKAENNANDSSGNTNNGIVDGTVTYAAGEVGNAFSFNGNIANNVRIPNSPSLQTSLFSVEYWVYFNTVQNAVIVTKRSPSGAGDAWQAGIVYTGGVFELQFVGYTTSGLADWYSGALASPVGVWTHVAMTYDGTNVVGYVNGVQVLMVTVSLALGGQNADIYIGTHPAAQPFNGLVDELTLCNRALSSNEVQGIYQAGTAGQVAPVAAVTGISPAYGPIAGGTSVTITGSNFVGVTSVTIGGVAATGVNVVNTTNLTAVTGANVEGAANVVVTTANGTATGTGLFSYFSGPPTVISQTVTNITGNSVKLGGNVSDNGGLTVTERGVVYALTATNGNPQISGTGVTKIATSGGTGVFTVNVSGLMNFSNYTFAAYAVNAVGTNYSATGMFTTSGKTFISYTGGNQTYIVPAGVTNLQVKLWGAKGSGGGGGGFAGGFLAVTPGQTLTIRVGGLNGFGGGGAGGVDQAGDGYDGFRGGGGSYIIINGTQNLAVAGGGGGGGYSGGSGGPGGGTTGGSGGVYDGSGGTQSAGGAGGSGGGLSGSQTRGGSGASFHGNPCGGGGGGGYFCGGGGGGDNNSYGGGGGGGSSYIAQLVNGYTIAGSGSSTGNTGDPDYVAGNNGLIVLTPYGQPTIGSPTIDSSGNLILTGSGLPENPYVLLTSTNMTLPLSLWTTNLTGAFDSTGNCSNAIPISTTNNQQFFLIKE